MQRRACGGEMVSASGRATAAARGRGGVAGACRSEVVSVSGRAARRRRRRGGAAGVCRSEVARRRRGGGERRQEAASRSDRGRVPGELSARLHYVSILFFAKSSVSSRNYPS